MRLTFSGAAIALAILPISGVVAQDSPWSKRTLPAVETAARSGDKAAQLELGDRYAEGDGVPCDRNLARRWYKRAARSNSSGRKLAYSAPVGSERYGRMAEVGGNHTALGSPEALMRLEALRTKRLPLGVKCASK